MIHKASQVAGDAVVGWTDKLPIVKKISPELGAATATALEAGTYFLLPKYAKNKVAKVLKPGKDIATAGARVPGFDKPGVAKTEKPFNIAEPPEVFQER